MPLSMLPVSLMLAGALALVNLWLSIRTGMVRQKGKVWIGDGGDEALIRRMRAQANLVENAPFVLALVVVIELASGTSLWLWAAAVAFVVARLAHPFGMDGWKPGRMIGASVTMLLLLVLGIWALVLVAVPRQHGGEVTPIEMGIAHG